MLLECLKHYHGAWRRTAFEKASKQPVASGSIVKDKHSDRETMGNDDKTKRGTGSRSHYCFIMRNR